MVANGSQCSQVDLLLLLYFQWPPSYDSVPAMACLADRIARACVHHYDRCLTKKGKPRDGVEWTPMAAVVGRYQGESDTACSDGYNTQQRSMGYKPGSRKFIKYPATNYFVLHGTVHSVQQKTL